jgi:predicted ATP-dependent endonuclease of OLD family
MDITFHEGSGIIAERSDNGILIQMQRSELESELSKDELSSVKDALFIPPERTFFKGPNGNMMNAVELYAKELSERIRDAKEDRRIITPVYADMDDDVLESMAKDLNAKLNFMREAGFEMDIPSGMRFPPSRYDLTESYREYSDLIHDVSEFVKKNYRLCESMVVLRDVMNGFLSDKTMGMDENGITFTLDSGATLPLNSLSSGERQIFIVLYRMLFEAPPHSLVMIDEPEISLHVSWQQRMGQVMKDVAKLRDLQVIAATHSPQMIHGDWDLTNELRAGRA